MSKVTSMTFYSGPARKKPAAGDMRYLKGRKVWQIRQQAMSRPFANGKPYPMVAHGRPVWEWVERGSERDRQWQHTCWNADQHHTNVREYMEAGCLCLIEGRMKIVPTETNRAAAARYLAQCTCSRHPNHGEKK